MNSTHTGIAVALALAVIIAFFIFPGLLPFGTPPQAEPNNEITATTTPNSSAMSTPDTTPITQLQITDEKVGTGAVAAAGQKVTVNYVGALINGTVFDASANHGSGGFSFNLGAGQVIQGWDQGIVGMKVGGKRKLVIPASLAYGDRGIPGVIPPNAALVFEVELLKVEKATQ